MPEKLLLNERAKPSQPSLSPGQLQLVVGKTYMSNNGDVWMIKDITPSGCSARRTDGATCIFQKNGRYKGLQEMNPDFIYHLVREVLNKYHEAWLKGKDVLFWSTWAKQWVTIQPRAKIDAIYGDAHEARQIWEETTFNTEANKFLIVGEV